MSAQSNNGILDKMMEDAMEEVVEKGWRNVSQNTITMACHKMSRDELKAQRCLIRGMIKPVYWLAGVLGTGIVWQIISSVVIG